MKGLELATAALVGVIWALPAGAADVDFATTIRCVIGESQGLTRSAEYEGDHKAERFNSWMGSMILSAGQTKGLTVTFAWHPWTPDGPRLRVTSNDTVHNSVRVLSRTKESLIAATSASDALTAESWLFALNFRQETVIGTQVQSNVAGVKGEAVGFVCDFTHEDAPPPQ